MFSPSHSTLPAVDGWMTGASPFDSSKQFSTCQSLIEIVKTPRGHPPTPFSLLLRHCCCAVLCYSWWLSAALSFRFNFVWHKRGRWSKYGEWLHVPSHPPTKCWLIAVHSITQHRTLDETLLLLLLSGKSSCPPASSTLFYSPPCLTQNTYCNEYQVETCNLSTRVSQMSFGIM